MAGATVLFELDDTELKELIDRMGGAIADMRPIMRPFGEYMILETEERFQKEESPDGTAWQPLSEVTIEMKEANNDIDKILQAQGNLLLSIVPEALKDGVKISTNRVYAAIHQFGGRAGRAHKVAIPARPFLGFNDADVREFTETVKDWIVMGRRPS